MGAVSKMGFKTGCFTVLAGLAMSVYVFGELSQDHYRRKNLMHIGSKFERYQNNLRMPVDARPDIMDTYDINGDGLEDTVLSDGTVLIRQENGSHVPLIEVYEKELEEVLGAFHEKYKFRKETERNRVDNLDYQVRTGKLILEEME